MTPEPETPPDPETSPLLRATEGAEAGFATVQADDDQGPIRRAGPLEKKVVSTLTSALKVSRLHALDNIVAVEALGELATALGELLQTKEEATLVLGDRRLFINGAALRARRTGHSWMDDLLEFLERMGLGGIVFRGRWSRDDLKELLGAFAGVKSRDPAGRQRELMLAVERIKEPAQVDLLDPESARALVAEGDEANIPEPRRALFYYARLLALAEASHVAVRAGRSPDFHVRHLRTTFMKIIEYLRTGLFQVRLMALTAQPPPQVDTLAGHAAAVTCLALAMGRLLGLSRGGLADLGFAALYHDLGRVALGREAALDGPGEDPATAHGHVGGGVAAALRGRGFGDGGLLRLVVASEHHRLADGFPDSAGLRRPHLYSRLVGVADAFSNLEQGTPWSAPVSPALALERLRADRDHHEPELVQLLEDVLGRRPRGTLLRLPSRAVAVVVDGGARRGHRPIARQLLHPDGSRDDRRPLLEVEGGEVLAPYALGLSWHGALLG